MAVDTSSITGVAAYKTASTSSTASKASTSDAKSASVDYDSFLKLLIAQMKNQDPTDPMDASEQLSQLATFSQVEQSIKANSHLEDLISQTAMNSAAAYIGKTVTSLDGATSGVVASVKVTTDGVIATTTDGKKITLGEGVTIRDTAAAAPTDVSNILGQTLTDKDGKAIGTVAGVTVTDEGAFATTAEGKFVDLSSEVTIKSTISTTGVDGTYFLGKTLTSADGTVTGKITAVTATASGVYGLTADGKGILIEKGVTLGDATS